MKLYIIIYKYIFIFSKCVFIYDHIYIIIYHCIIYLCEYNCKYINIIIDE